MSADLPIRIIVGLGNPGRDYAETRHNVGFMVLDRLARRFGAEWKLDKARKGELAAGPGVLLIKPQTFMNCSGECVGPIMLRSSGSAGGHNGMKSLIAHRGGEKFPRIRVGIGAPGQKEMVGHVLGRFAPDERPLLEDCLAKAEEATVMMMREGFQAAANKFNVKKEKKGDVQNVHRTE